MKKVYATESSSDNRVDFMACTWDPHHGIAANMRKYITLSHLNQSKLRVVAMREVVFQAMKTSTQQPEGFVKVALVSVSSIRPSELNATGEEVPDMLRAGHDASVLVGNVVLETGLFINRKLSALVYRASQSLIVLASISIVGIVLWVINI